MLNRKHRSQYNLPARISSRNARFTNRYSVKNTVVDNELFKAVFEFNPTPLMILNRSLNIHKINASACALLGYTPSGQPAKLPLMLPVLGIICRKFINSGKNRYHLGSVEIKINEEMKYFELTLLRLNAEKLLVYLKDIGDMRLLRSKLRQAQKMESIGQLTSGLAHDFNNLLTIIGGYADISARKLKDHETRKFVDQIYSTAEKGTSMIRGLLTFTRKNEGELRLCNINNIVSSVATLTERTINELINIHTRLCKSPLYTLADHVQIEQILLNLITNAVDAMPEGGTIRLTTDKIHKNDVDADCSHEGTTDYLATIKVEDTGCGMEAAVMEKIFEPFFTTKPPSKGTGLGLAMVDDLVKNNNGIIKCHSIVNEGTVFTIYMPLISLNDLHGNKGYY